MYPRTRNEVADIRKYYEWLERAGLQDNTAALILGAQEHHNDPRPRLGSWFTTTWIKKPLETQFEC